MQQDLTERRRWYAQDLKLRAPVRRHMAIAEAFAAVPRERFLGPGPWACYWTGILTTPSSRPMMIRVGFITTLF
jgi:hypothetical protein